jgi:hypothetical protein
MSVLEAIQLFWMEVKLLAAAIGDGHHIYLDDLKRSLPNWGTTLDNLVKSNQENLPRIGANLTSLGEQICMLETKDPAGSLNPFMSLGASLGNWGMNRGHYVQQTNFEKAEAEIQEAFCEVKEALWQQASGGSVPTGLTAKVDKALKQLGKIEGRITGVLLLNEQPDILLQEQSGRLAAHQQGPFMWLFPGFI